MNIYEKLSNIQNELKVPKAQDNKFGGYKYRSCEDILEAAKPICKKYGAVLVLSDEIVVLGEGNTRIIEDDEERTRRQICTGQRFYIKAIATLYDTENNNEQILNMAYAREEENKKGMDGSQITGTASSYARKYALNGLFNIDDTKDADTNEYTERTTLAPDEKVISNTMEKALRELCKNVEKDTILAVMKEYGYEKFAEIKMKDYNAIRVQLESGRRD